MIWEKFFKYVPQYGYVSTNQHGDRYKQVAAKKISCAKLSANASNATDMRTLILLSCHLDTPVRYNFEDPQTAYIEVLAQEAVL